MNLVFILVPLALFLSLFFVACFIFACRFGQYDDLDTPPHRMILDDEESPPQG